MAAALDHADRVEQYTTAAARRWSPALCPCLTSRRQRRRRMAAPIRAESGQEEGQHVGRNLACSSALAAHSSSQPARARGVKSSRGVAARGDHTSCTRSGGASFTRSINTTVMTRLMLTNEFGAAIAVVVAGSAAANWFGAVQVMKARKKYGVAYPTLYATGEGEDTHMVNSAQRAHQNTLENLPIVNLMTIAGALTSPRHAALFGTTWVVGALHPRVFDGRPEWPAARRRDFAPGRHSALLPHAVLDFQAGDDDVMRENFHSPVPLPTRARCPPRRARPPTARPRASTRRAPPRARRAARFGRTSCGGRSSSTAARRM